MSLSFRTALRFAPLALAALLAGQPRPVAAHGDPADEVAGLTRLLRLDPANVGLLSKRAELNLGAGWWGPAIADYEALLKLDAKNDAAEFGLGRALLGAEKFAQADAALTRFIERRPAAVPALEARARARAKLGRAREAAADYARAIELDGAPDPDNHLERARVLATLGGAAIDEALRGLDEAMAKLGPVPALAACAIDLEVQRARPDAALKRLGAIEPKSGRKDAWLARRGEVLEASGDPAAARAAYTQALGEIGRLPDERRLSQMTQDLETKLNAAISRIDAGSRPGEGRQP